MLNAIAGQAPSKPAEPSARCTLFSDAGEWGSNARARRAMALGTSPSTDSTAAAARPLPAISDRRRRVTCGSVSGHSSATIGRTPTETKMATNGATSCSSMAQYSMRTMREMT